MAVKKKKPAPKKKLPSRKPGAKKPAKKSPASRATKSGAKASGKRRVVRTSKRPSARPKRPAAKKGPGPKLLENPQALKLARTIAAIAQDKKAHDVLVIDTRRRGAAVGYDYIVLATGESDRQLAAISEALREELKPQGIRPTSVEASPDWVLVNFDDVVAHLFSGDTRAMYDLEGLWSDAPRVALKA